MNTRRTYDNSRRAAQAEKRVEQILDAVMDILGSPERDLSVASIAQKAGVSVPTVNKYFPNRQAIFEAVQERIDERYGRPPQPQSPEQLRASIPRLHQFFAEHEATVRAVVTAPELRPFWEVANRQRNEGVRRAFKKLTAHLPEDEAAAVCGMVIMVIGTESWMALKDDWGLDDAAVTAASIHMLDLILADLRKGAEKGNKG